MNKTDISEKIYYSVISVIIAVSAAWMMFLSWNFRIELQDIALWVILFALINTTRDVIKNRIVTAGVIIYIIVAVTVVGVMENNAVYAGILMGIFVVYMLSYRLTVHEVFRIAAGFVCVAGTFITFHYNGDIPKLLVVMTVILLLNACVDCLYVAGVNRSSGRSLIAVYAVIGISLLMTPVKSEPYGWKCIYMIADKAAGCFARLVNGLEYYIKNEADIYEFNYTQYTGNGRVNVGKLIDNDNVSVIVSGKKTANNLYLKGNVNAAFDGQRWYPADNLSYEAEYIYEAEKMHEADTWMTLYACYALSEDADDIKRYISLRMQTVTFENIRTKTAFLPAKLIKLPEQTYIDGDNIRFSKVLNKRNQYSYDFIDIDYSDASFNDVLRHSSEVAYSEDTWNKMVSYMQDEYNIMPSFDYQHFLKYVKMCDDFADDVYLMVDDNVSGDVRNLASDIAAGGNGTYEVCSRLTDYLKQYRYDKRTYIPDGVNVIDYFLYEKKSGYCIHYATALTEMLRCNGIPSRLVEGFCNNYERKDDEGDYNIIGNDSHAWVEAYVRGVGWVRLEPTNGYGVVVKSDDIAEVVDTEEIQESGINIDRNSSADIKNWKITIFAGALILMAISLALICCVRYRQLQKSCDIDVLFDDILRILGKKYAKKEASETVKEYFARLDISDEMAQQLGTLQQCMERLWYGGKDSDNAGYNSVDVDFIKMVRYRLKQGDRKT